MPRSESEFAALLFKIFLLKRNDITQYNTI